MTRIALLLAIEGSALAAMLALPVQLPWSDRHALALMPEELVAAGIVRMAAIGIVAWLLISTLLYLVAAPIPALRTVIGRVTAPVVRRVVDTALAATLSVTVVSPAVAAEAPPEPIVITVGESSTGEVIIPPGMAIAQPDPTTLPPPRAESSATADPSSGTSRRASPVEAAMFPVAVRSQVREAATYQVQRGDHLWSIAENVLKQRSGRSIVPDHEIAPFWRRLIDTNLASLRSGNPDLIYPGEILSIPESSS